MIKYNEEVKSILKKSELEALNNKDEYVGTEHVLLSISKNKNSLSNIFNNLNITYDKIKKETKKGKSSKEYILYKKEILKIIETIAYEEDNIIEEIDLSILFKGIISDRKSTAYKILTKININIDALKMLLEEEEKSTIPLTIKELGINLTEMAKKNELDKVIGRDQEIEKIIEILSRKNKNNPILVGEAGVGKTAIVEELAKKIINGEVPNNLKDKEIINLNLFSVIAGTKYRGEFEEKLSKIIKELESNQNIILFIDEIHTIMGAGGAEGAIDASNIMKPALARGKIKVIGATTLNEYKTSIEKDKALDRRFQKILIKEPNYEETKIILKKIKKNYEKYHNVIIPEHILDLTIKLSNKYISDRKNPDKSIDILDEICASTKINDKNTKYSKLKNKIVTLKQKKLEYISKNNLKMASIINENIKKYNEELKNIENKIIKNKVTITTLKKVLESKTNTPIYELENPKYLDNIKDKLYNKFNLNNKILDKLIDILKIHLTKYTNRPTSLEITNNLEISNTLVEELSKILKMNLIKLDLNEYQDSTSINKIIGSPAGYIGYEDKNTIFEKLKTYPISIIYIENYNNTNQNIKNLFSNILKTGELTLSNNEIIKFNNSLIIFANKKEENNSLGFINNKIENKKSIYDYSININNKIQLYSISKT